MKKLYYTITTLEPIIITIHSDDPNMYETLEFIRGTVIQGVFAQHYLRNNGNIADAKFVRLIVTGDGIFANAYPWYKGKLFLPAPFYFVREKYKPESVHNLLINKTDQQTRGISALVSTESNQVLTLTIPKNIRLHNEIDDNKRTTKESVLFNYQSLPSGLVFKGFIVLRNDNDELDFKNIIVNESEIRMGRSATSEYGKVRFNWLKTETRKLPKEKSEEKNEDDSLMNGEIIMTLLSDTIVFNQFGYSSTNIDDLNLYLENTKIVQAISRKSRTEGFLNVWKLRKPSENVFAAGSSFKLERLPTNEEYILDFGIGERTHEGFGQVSFAFHPNTGQKLQFNEPLKFGDEITLPNSMPALVQEIVKSAYFERAKSEIIGKALVDAKSTNWIPKNHLLSRLKGMAGDNSTFVDNIKLLKDIAKKQLENSHVNSQTLFNHLIDRTLHIEKICPLIHPVESFTIDLEKFKSELTRLYLVQYLNQLRRKN